MPAHFQRLPTTHASLMITLWLLSREARISMSSLPPKAPTKWPKGLRFSTLHFKVDGFLYETSIVLVFGLFFVFVHFRAIFNLVAKVIRVCFDFALFWSVIGPSRHLLNQSDTISELAALVFLRFSSFSYFSYECSLANDDVTPSL